MTAVRTIRKIPPKFCGKIWGSTNTSPWFAERDLPPLDEPLGEVWFPDNDLLVKFIFTSQNLSIQVHPDDAFARTHGDGVGKTEMWHILRAEPGARIALGFKSPIPSSELKPLAQSGAIMDAVNWIEVRAGETYFVPPGTVHAIGAGIALCEIQQNSNLTYRLYDYGRDRELHLEIAVELSDTGCHPGASQPIAVSDEVEQLVRCDYFTTYRASLTTRREIGAGLGIRMLVVCNGRGRIDGIGAKPGDVFQIESAGELDGWMVEPEDATTSGPFTLLLVG